jgi:hypothetical protein
MTTGENWSNERVGSLLLECYYLNSEETIAACFQKLGKRDHEQLYTRLLCIDKMMRECAEAWDDAYCLDFGECLDLGCISVQSDAEFALHEHANHRCDSVSLFSFLDSIIKKGVLSDHHTARGVLGLAQNQ